MSRLVETARTFLGQVKYVFGANDVIGGKADCSSFIQYVLSVNGINVGRTTGEQWTSGGTKVSKENLQAGDLVFFHSTYNSGYVDNVSHVGIYAGNGKFIHCSSGAGTVVESSLDENYWNVHFLGGLRKNGAYIVDKIENESVEIELGNTRELTLFGTIVKYFLIIGLIVTGIVALVLTLGLEKNIIKGFIGG